MNINRLFFVNGLSFRDTTRGEHQFSVIHTWLMCTLFHLSLGKIQQGRDTLRKLSQRKLCISIKIESSDYSYQVTLTCGSAHFAEEPLQVFMVNVFVIPVIYFLEEPFYVEIIACRDLLLNYLLFLR